MAGSRSGSSGKLLVENRSLGFAVPLSVGESKIVALKFDVFRFIKVFWRLPNDGRCILLRGG